MSAMRVAQQRVRDALRGSPSVSKSLIDVRVRRGRLELHGLVHSFRAKLEAERIAREQCREELVNLIDVTLDEPASARELARNTRAALRQAEDLDTRTVTVQAHGRKVVLRGTVASPWSRQAAGDIAVGVPGVKEVVNLVRVDDREQRIDRHAAESILNRLRRHRRLCGKPIDVAVSGGTAVLRGRVDSKQERRLAERIASEFPVLRIRNRIRLAP